MCDLRFEKELNGKELRPLAAGVPSVVFYSEYVEDLAALVCVEFFPISELQYYKFKNNWILSRN